MWCFATWARGVLRQLSAEGLQYASTHVVLLPCYHDIYAYLHICVCIFARVEFHYKPHAQSFTVAWKIQRLRGSPGLRL